MGVLSMCALVALSEISSIVGPLPDAHRYGACLWMLFALHVDSLRPPTPPIGHIVLNNVLRMSTAAQCASWAAH